MEQEQATATEAIAAAGHDGNGSGVSSQPNSSAGSSSDLPAGQNSYTGAGNGNVGGGAATANTADLMKAYRAQIQQLLAKHKKYPKRAKRRGYQGRVSLRFSVDRSGNISGLEIAQSSGHNTLDQSTLKALRTMPFPPPPAELSPERKTFSFTIPVDYRLR